MNKAKTILTVIGGVSALLILVMAYLAWSALNAKSAAIDGDDEEGIDGLDNVMQRATTLSRKTVYPCKQSLDEIASNRLLLAEWKDDAFKIAARGDKVFPATTPAAFKAFIMEDAKRLRELPGGNEGNLVSADFAFGPFRSFITEGKMPLESDLAKLQRQWDDVSEVVSLLAGAGVSEVTDIAIKAAESAKPEEKRTRQKRGAARNAKKDAVEFMDTVSKHSYIFSFSTRPAGLVSAINRLEVSGRFIVVEDFTFSRPQDAIAEALGGENRAKDAQTAGRGRRSRRRLPSAQPEEAEEKKSGKGAIVTDPLLDAPLAVTMTVTVYDFKSLEKEAK